MNAASLRSLALDARFILSIVVLVGAVPALSRADGEAGVDGAEVRSSLAVTVAASAVAATFALDGNRLAPDGCRSCEPGRLDAAARSALAWDHPGRARLASDVTTFGLIPVLVLADAWRSAGAMHPASRDLLVLAEAIALTGAATEVAKTFTARRRPDPSLGLTDSFWSGHTALAFSAVVAQATQDTMRGDSRAPWVWVLGLGLASTVGYLRLAGDAHWLTDVVAAAGVGSLAGATVPLLNRRLVDGVAILPAPGGFAVRF